MPLISPVPRPRPINQYRADGVPVKVVLATQIAEAQIVVLDGSPIKTIGDLKGKKIGMSPPGSATHAIATSILDQNFGLKPNEYSIAPGNETQLAQFLSQKDIDAGVLRSVTLAQMEEVKLRRLGSVVDEWKKLTKGNSPPILAVTIVYKRLLAKNAESGGEIHPATRNALQYGSKNNRGSPRFCKKRQHERHRRARLRQPVGRAYIWPLRTGGFASLKRSRHRQSSRRCHQRRSRRRLRLRPVHAGEQDQVAG